MTTPLEPQNMHQATGGFEVPAIYVGQTLRGVFREMTSGNLARREIPSFSAATTVTCDFFEIDEGQEINGPFLTVVSLIGATNPSPTTNSALSLFGSAMCMVYPNLKPSVLSVLNSNGIGQNVISLPSQAEANFITMQTTASFNKCLIMFGEMVFMVYKNLNSTNYMNFMSKRVVAMAAVIGFALEDPRMLVTSNVDLVIKIKTAYGGNVKFKVDLLLNIINGWELNAPLGNFFSYVGGILKYTDMSAFTFIADTLMYHRSPVLTHPAVQSEVEKLAEAFSAILASPYPQYFRIMARPSVGKLLERSNFPTLLSVAQGIKAKLYTTVNQFKIPMNVNTNIVSTLINIHEAHVAGLVINPQRTAISFLSSFGPADGETDQTPIAERGTLTGNSVVIQEIQSS